MASSVKTPLLSAASALALALAAQAGLAEGKGGGACLPGSPEESAGAGGTGDSGAFKGDSESPGDDEGKESCHEGGGALFASGAGSGTLASAAGGSFKAALGLPSQAGAGAGPGAPAAGRDSPGAGSLSGEGPIIISSDRSSALTGTAGADAVLVTSGATMTGLIDLGAGDDSVTVELGAAAGRISLSSGSNSLRGAGAVTGDVTSEGALAVGNFASGAPESDNALDLGGSVSSGAAARVKAARVAGTITSALAATVDVSGGIGGLSAGPGSSDVKVGDVGGSLVFTRGLSGAEALEANSAWETRLQAGSVSGSIKLNGGTNNVVAGDVEGLVSAGDGDDTIKVGHLTRGGNGVIQEHTFGGGTNRVEALSVTAMLRGGSGADTFIVKGDIKAAHLMAGENRLEAGSVSWFVFGGPEADTVIVTGDLDQAALGFGANEVRAGSVSGYYRGGDGPDTVIVAGDLGGSVYLHEGSNYVEAATVSASVEGGDGPDTLIVAGILDGRVDLSGGENRIEAAAVSGSVDGGDGPDTLIVAGDLDWADLSGGENRIEAGSVSRRLYGGSGPDAFIIKGASGPMHLGEGANIARAASIDSRNYTSFSHGLSVTAGSGDDSLVVTGAVSIPVDLGGGANTVEIGALLASLETGEGDDSLLIGEGAGGAALGGGANSMTVSGGPWSGDYSGGSGKDTVTIAAGASSSGDLSLGGGGDLVRAAGPVSGSILAGAGNDVIGGLERGSFAGALGRVDLGGGSNSLRAATATAISGGAGYDAVYLRPGSGMELSALDLGGGVNKVWIGGAAGDPSARRAVVSMSGSMSGGSPDASLNDSLYLCAGDFALDGCAGAPEAGHSLNVVLDASAGNAWETVRISVPPGEVQSRLSVKGEVTLLDPELNDILVSGDGKPGDAITVSGTYEILPAAGGLGTLFELDAGLRAGIHRSDQLRFAGAAKTASAAAPGGRSFVSAPAVRVRMSTTRTPLSGTRLDLVTVDPASDITGISLQGLEGGEITLQGHVWAFGSREESGATTYFIEHQGFAPASEHLVITGDGDTAGDVTAHPGVKHVTLAGDWAGSYTGLPGADMITISSGALASGESWRLFGGDNVIIGVGAVRAAVTMGDGDDRIGDFGDSEINGESSLSFGGPVDLGGGSNWMRAEGAASVSAGDGPDTIILGGDVPGAISLGGGETANSLTVSGLVGGDVTSEAAGPSGAWDRVSIGGGSGSARLGGGANELALGGAWSGSYSGGSGPDIVISASGGGLSGESLDFGGGSNSLTGRGEVLGKVTFGGGNDRIGPPGAGGADRPEDGFHLRGAVDLGGGANEIAAASAGAVSAGDGDDTIILSGPAGAVDLGGGANRLVASGAEGYSGGDGPDTVDLRSASGDIHLGGGTADNFFQAWFGMNGTITSEATGKDEVIIGAGETEVDLGGGENALTILGRSWTGSYRGGPGADTIAFSEYADRSFGSLDLGGGDNVITNEDWLEIRGGVTLGDGDDEILGAAWSPRPVGSICILPQGCGGGGGGPSAFELMLQEFWRNILFGPDPDDAPEASSVLARTYTLDLLGPVDLGGGNNTVKASSAVSLAAGDGDDQVIVSGSAGAVDLGGGSNLLEAEAALSIAAGDGDDRVYLVPASDFSMSSLSLGGGSNSLWILGAEGTAEGRRASIPLSGGGPEDTGSNQLHLCNEDVSETGCGPLKGTERSFSAALDASGGNVWGAVRIGVEPSSHRSRLSVLGSVTLADPGLNDFVLAGNGAPGDEVTVTGTYEILAPGSGRGTLFELDVSAGPAATASDVLRFAKARAAAGQSPDGRDFVTAPTISLRLSSHGSRPPPGSRLEIATVDSASDISGISVAGADPGGGVTLGSHAWTLSSETSGGMTKYFLSYGGDAGDPEDDYLRITGTGDTAGDVSLGGGRNQVVVAGDWAGSYTGLDGADEIHVMAGVTASGREWLLGGGPNSLSGSGTVSARVVMGAGDDTVGAFGPGAAPSGSALALSGGLELGHGANRVRAKSAAAITGGRDSDSIELSGAATGHVDLGGGDNSLRASGAASVTGGSGPDTVSLSGGGGPVDLGEGANTLEAQGDVESYAGGDGPDRVVVEGFFTGSASLGGGSGDNHLDAFGAAGEITSEATGRDSVVIHADSGHIRLGGGANELTVSGSEWGGDYEGGGGPDTISMEFAWASGDWNLGGGANEIKSSGIHFGSITLGDGDDWVGAIGYPGLNRVDLGGGTNRLWASSAVSISGGSGPDSVYLRPRGDMGLSSLDLGGGSNGLWILGRTSPVDSPAALNLSLGGSGRNRLYLCNESFAADGCGFWPEGDHAFDVVLDARGGSVWDSVRVGVSPSDLQSRLSVLGSVTLLDPELSDFMLAGNGVPGDEVTVTGSYKMLEASGSRGGALFELDVIAGGAPASDILRFQGARTVAGLSSDSRRFVAVAPVALRVSGDASAPPLGSRVDIVTVDSDSDISGVSLAGVGPAGAILLNSHLWTLSREVSGGLTVYYLSHGADGGDPGDPPNDGDDGLVITGTGETAGNVNLGGGANTVTVTGDWSGSYTGLDGVDDMTVELGVTLSGLVVRLGGGDNVLKGSGTVLAQVAMGGGDDRIGGAPGDPGSDSGLALSGGVILGDGANRLRAAAAGPISGGRDSDSIAVSGSVSGHVDLGGGENDLRAESAVSITGGEGPDTVILSGWATGHVDLGGGANRLEAAGAHSVTGGGGPDEVLLGAKPLGDIDLGSGRNSLAVAAGIDTHVKGGDGADEVSFAGGAGRFSLGGGVNRLSITAGEWSGSYVDGAGADTIHVASGASVLEYLELGRGDNAVMGSGELAGSLYMGAGDDTIGNFAPDAPLSDNQLVLAGEIVDLGEGRNMVRASRAEARIYGGVEADDTVILDGGAFLVDLQGGANRLEAASVDIYEGGSGPDTVLLSGKGGRVDLGGGDNRLEAKEVEALYGGSGGVDDFTVRGHVGSANLRGGENRAEFHTAGWIYGGEGSDTIVLWGNAEHVLLDRGDNAVTLKGGKWSGLYSGGQGADVITVDFGAELSLGSFSALGGENQVKGSGAVLSKLQFGGAAATIGNFAPGAPLSDNRLDLRAPVHLWSGSNRLWAASAVSIKGGSSEDLVVLRPESSFHLSTLDLGGGENKMWLLGSPAGAGGLESRRATVSLSAGAGTDALYICRESFDLSGGCGPASRADSAFNVVLDASGGSAWETVRVLGEPGEVQSVLTAKGEVTLHDPEFGSLILAGDGVAGDVVTVSGAYGILPAFHGDLPGTVFELDADFASSASDILRFELAVRLGGGEFTNVPSVRVRPVSPSGPVDEDSRIDIVVVGPDSDIGGVSLEGASEGRLELGGKSWALGSEPLDGGTVYFLAISPDIETVSGGSRSMDFGDGTNILTVLGSWSGSYTGGSGSDTVTVAAGAEALGRLDFGGGRNFLKGSGSVGGDVVMGDGDDTVGSFGAAASASGGGLSLLGHLDLGGGENRVNALSAAGVAGGGGYDDVALANGSDGSIDLGGGPRNRLVAGGPVLGDVRSSAAGELMDEFAVGAVSGAVDLGGGANLLVVSGVVGSYRGGSGNDTVILKGGSVSGSIALGGGENVVAGGAGNDSVSLEGGSAEARLGGGNNTLRVSGGWSGSYEAGAGDDRFVSLGPSFLESADLGEGRNTVLAADLGSLAAGSGGDLVTISGRASGIIDLGGGDDAVVLKGGARVGEASFKLGAGANRVFAEGAAEGGSGVTEIDLSKFQGGGSLVICGGEASPAADGCAAGQGWIPGFSVALATEGAQGFSVAVENAGAAEQSLLSVSGDLSLQASSLGNVRIATEGAPGRTVTLAGAQAFSESTVIALDVSRGVSDTLEIESTARPAGAGGASGPLVTLRPVQGGEGGGAREIPIAWVRQGSGAELRFSDSSVFLGDDIWQVMPARENDDGDLEYYLAPEGMGLGERAAAAQRVLSASGAIASSIAAASPVQVLRPGLAGSVGVSQDGPGDSGASLWTRLTFAEETERLRIGQVVSEFEQSLWVLDTGAEVFTQRVAGGELSHSLIAQYGSSSSGAAKGSGQGLESRLAGLGYSLLYQMEGGSFARLSAMSSGISGRAGREEFSLGGSSVSAEAGHAFRAGGESGHVLTVSPLARLSLSQFGEVRLRSGDSSGIEKASGALALFADYESGSPGGDGGARTIYGGVTLTHDFRGGFEFVPKDSDGNRAVAISVDSGKTWAAFEAGWAWSFGDAGRAFVEASRSSASGQAGGERQSWTLGFDLSW